AIGLVVASRTASEEFAGGCLNLLTWPMMFLSEVWFSLEGAPEWVKTFSHALPLSHLVDASRKIMNDGAGLVDVAPELVTLAGMSAFFIAVGAARFRWVKS